MPIRLATIKDHSKKFLVLSGLETLDDALRQAHESRFQWNQTYLVVRLSDNEYRASLLLDFESVIRDMGYDAFTQKLDTLPIPAVEIIEPLTTSKNWQDIENLLRLKPGAIIIITAEGGVVGLLANPTRSGTIVEGPSLLKLYGELVQISSDPRSEFVALVSPPTCPICGCNNFFRFDPPRRIYTCPNCNNGVKQP